MISIFLTTTLSTLISITLFFLGLSIPYNSIITIIISIILVMYIIFDIYRYTNICNNNTKTRDWIKTTGTISFVQVETFLSKERVRIFYGYTVKGNKYTGQNYTLSFDLFDINETCKRLRIKKEDLKSKTAIGRKIPVYYNPVLFGESVINSRAYTQLDYFTLSTGIALSWIILIFSDLLITQLLSVFHLSF